MNTLVVYLKPNTPEEVQQARVTFKAGLSILACMGIDWYAREEVNQCATTET